MNSCNICYDDMKDYMLQNPNYCCSLKICESCYNTCSSSGKCPGCRKKIKGATRVRYMSDEFIDLYSDELDWDVVSSNRLSEYILLRYKDRINWRKYFQGGGRLSIDMIRIFCEVMDWDALFSCSWIDKRHADAFTDKIDWGKYNYSNADAVFISKYMPRINWKRFAQTVHKIPIVLIECIRVNMRIKADFSDFLTYIVRYNRLGEKYLVELNRRYSDFITDQFFKEVRNMPCLTDKFKRKFLPLHILTFGEK